MEQLYVWRVKTRFPDRKGSLCRVLVRGKLNNCLVQFLSDGYKTVTSRNYIRKNPLAINLQPLLF